MPRPLMALFIEFLLALPCPLCYPVYKHKFHKESGHLCHFCLPRTAAVIAARRICILVGTLCFIQLFTTGRKTKKTGLVRCRQHCVLRYELLLDRRRFFGFFAATEEEVLKDGTG